QAAVRSVSRPAAVLAGPGIAAISSADLPLSVSAGPGVAAISSAVFPPSVVAGPGVATICARVFPPSFFALSATRARFASGTIPADTAVPVSETKSASDATTSAGLGRRSFLSMRPSLGRGGPLDAYSSPRPPFGKELTLAGHLPQCGARLPRATRSETVALLRRKEP